MTNLLLARLKKGIKQQELAKNLGITPQYLRLIEKGDIDPRASLMKKCSEVLEISVEELFFNENEIDKTFNKER